MVTRQDLLFFKTTLLLAGGEHLSGHLYPTVLYIENGQDARMVILLAKQRGKEGDALKEWVYPAKVSFDEPGASPITLARLEARVSGIGIGREMVALTRGAFDRLEAKATGVAGQSTLALWLASERRRIGETPSRGLLVGQIQSGIDFRIHQDSRTALVPEPLIDHGERYFMDLNVFMVVAAALGQSAQLAGLEEDDDFRSQTGRGRAGGEANHRASLVTRFFEQFAPGRFGKVLGRVFIQIAYQSRGEFDHAFAHRDPILLGEDELALFRHGHDRHRAAGIDAVRVLPPARLNDAKELALPPDIRLVVHGARNKRNIMFSVAPKAIRPRATRQYGRRA